MVPLRHGLSSFEARKSEHLRKTVSYSTQRKHLQSAAHQRHPEEPRFLRGVSKDEGLPTWIKTALTRFLTMR